MNIQNRNINKAVERDPCSMYSVVVLLYIDHNAFIHRFRSQPEVCFENYIFPPYCIEKQNLLAFY